MAPRKNDKPSELEDLYDSDLVSDNFASRKVVAQKAVKHVTDLYDHYRQLRRFRRGGKDVDLVEEWNQRYRMYKGIYLQSDHNYNGTAKTFNPILRKVANVVESEGSNAVLGRSDYYSVEAKGSDEFNEQMAREAFGTIKYYSDKEDYPSQFQLAMKQAIIYDSTAVETVYTKEKVTGVYRQLVEKPILDMETREPLINPDTGEPVTEKTFEIRTVDEDKPTVRVEVRDIYRLYINHLSNNPEKDDIIYRDAKTKQELIELAERNVYYPEAVKKILKRNPSYGMRSDWDEDSSGEGKTTFADDTTSGEQFDSYEVLRFQGLFTEENEETGEKLRRQFWIDIGERDTCLMCRVSPVIGGHKTFSLCNYDDMPGEFNSDSVISPFKGLQFEINDKENQSLDGLTFNLNGPIEVMKGSGIQASDILAARKQPNKVLFSKVKDAVKKIQVDVPLNHLNQEQIRLANMIEQGSGATSLVGGSPTGTQVDRSGKALGTLLNQSRSQFSKFVRKFEKQLIEKSLQKVWDMIIQFFDDEIPIEVLDDRGGSIARMQNPAEIVGQFNISVAAGSQFLREREYRDAILEFFSIASTSDEFMAMIDKPPILRTVARTLSPKLEKFINEEGFIQQLQGMIQQLQQALQQSGEMNKDLAAEANRLRGVVKQTDRSAESNPSILDRKKMAEN